VTPDDLEALGRVALAADFDSVPWEEAPEWRREAARAVAKAAVSTFKVSACEIVRSAWTNAMCSMGWRWDRVFDEKAKTHPGIVFGELTRGGVKHWMNVVDLVRAAARERGVRLTGE